MSNLEYLITNIIFENYKGVEKIRSKLNRLTQCYEITIYFKSGFKKEIEVLLRDIRKTEELCFENYKNNLTIFIKAKIDEVDFIRN